MSAFLQPDCERPSCLDGPPWEPHSNRDALRGAGEAGAGDPASVGDGNARADAQPPEVDTDKGVRLPREERRPLESQHGDANPHDGIRLGGKSAEPGAPDQDARPSGSTEHKPWCKKAVCASRDEDGPAHVAVCVQSCTCERRSGKERRQRYDEAAHRQRVAVVAAAFRVNVDRRKAQTEGGDADSTADRAVRQRPDVAGGGPDPGQPESRTDTSAPERVGSPKRTTYTASSPDSVRRYRTMPKDLRDTLAWWVRHHYRLLRGLGVSRTTARNVATRAPHFAWLAGDFPVEALRGEDG